MIMSHPLVKAAILQVATEVSSRGIFECVDITLDYIAEKIARQIVLAEIETQSQER